MVVLQYACEEFGADGLALTVNTPNTDPLIGMGGLRDGYPTGTLAASTPGENGNVPANLVYTKATFGTVNGATNNQNDAGTNTVQDKPPEGSVTAGTYAFGTTYVTPPATTAGMAAPVANTASDLEYGYHETWESYQACKNTQRNKGLYVSDQKLNRNAATATRQNPNGNRRGFECPEERDYYPYWRPTMWKDVAILTSDEAMCPYFQARSQNTNSKWYCRKPDLTNVRRVAVLERALSLFYSFFFVFVFVFVFVFSSPACLCLSFLQKFFSFFLSARVTRCTALVKLIPTLPISSPPSFARYLSLPQTGDTSNLIPITFNGCVQASGVWTEVPSWSAKGYAVGVPDCRLHSASRNNNLGNSRDAYTTTPPGTKEEMAAYRWTIPTLGPKVEYARCILRARYNISTNDYPSIAGAFIKFCFVQLLQLKFEMLQDFVLFAFECSSHFDGSSHGLQVWLLMAEECGITCGRRSWRIAPWTAPRASREHPLRRR